MKSVAAKLQQITKQKPYVTVYESEKFRLHCCDCGLVHDITVSAYGLAGGTTIRIRIQRNNRATNYRRKLKEKTK